MQIVDGEIRPCPTCLAMRSSIKRFAAKAARLRTAPFELIVTASGESVVIESTTGEVRVASEGAAHLLGIKLYVSTKYLFDIETAARYDSLGRPVSIQGLFGGSPA